MVYLLEKPYKNWNIYPKPRYRAMFEYADKEAAIARLIKLYPTEIFTANSFWIEDEKGNILMTPRQTKKEAARRYISQVQL